MTQITDRDGNSSEIDQKEVKQLEYICELVRRDILETLYSVGRGHSGPSLSLVEILVTLYFRELRLDPTDPKWPDRDRFILSKGHGAVGLYSVFAERGLIPKYYLPESRHPLQHSRNGFLSLAIWLLTQSPMKPIIPFRVTRWSTQPKAAKSNLHCPVSGYPGFRRFLVLLWE